MKKKKLLKSFLATLFHYKFNIRLNIGNYGTKTNETLNIYVTIVPYTRVSIFINNQVENIKVMLQDIANIL